MIVKYCWLVLSASYKLQFIAYLFCIAVLCVPLKGESGDRRNKSADRGLMTNLMRCFNV